MGWKVAAAVLVVIVVVVAAAAVLWPDGDDDVGEVTDVSLHTREDVHVGDWIDLTYTYPDILDVPIPVRMTVVSVGDDGVKVSVESLGDDLGEQYLDDTVEEVPAGEETVDTAFGRTMCQKFTETVDGETWTSWYLDDVMVRAEGSIDGERCIVELTGSSLVTPVEGDGPDSITTVFMDPASQDPVIRFDVLGHSVGLTVRSDTFPSAEGDITTLYYTLNIGDMGDASVSSVSVNATCDGGLSLIYTRPSTGDVYDNHPEIEVTNGSDLEAGVYDVTFDGIGGGDATIGGMVCSYFYGEEGGNIVGTVTFDTSEGVSEHMFVLTFGASV